MNIPLSKTKLHAILATIASSTILVACGGGGSTTTAVPSQAISNLYSQTNATANQIVHMRSNADGSLTVQGAATSTGGAGTNTGADPLTSQYSVIASPDHKTLYAVNAADNSISSFSIDGSTGDLTLIQKNATTGTLPVSLAFSGGNLYVLFQGSKTVQAYPVSNGVLGTPIGSYTIPSAGTKPTEILSSPDGAYVLVSAGTSSNTIVSYPVIAGGALDTPVVNTAGILAPFAATFLSSNTLLSTDAAGHALQSLHFAAGVLSTNGIEVVGDGAGNPCWLAITPNGKYAFTGDGGSGNIVSYAVSSAGVLSLIDPRAASENIAVAGDSWISADGKFLYSAYLAQGTVIAYAIGTDGSLTKVGTPALVTNGNTMQGLVGI